MLKIKEYVKAADLEQAWQLNQKKNNRVLGGMLWMKMSTAQIGKAIDLSGLGLDQIAETEEEFVIGAMVTLRQLELNEALNQYADGILRAAVKDIVGVQFRNLATVGGSIWGRFGFSDVLTAFLAMDTYVELYKGGIVPLRKFVGMKKDRDILVKIIVKKTNRRYAYLTHRNTKTDFPVLAVCLAKDGEDILVSCGARPREAMLLSGKLAGEITEETATVLATEMAGQIPTGSNMRASAEYRTHLAKVLIKRALLALS